ncbi:hypothetical protein CPB85DRAFT_1441394 [Mucidula mucida]|nr:hypothetical protein CPB85DRAFT_1441394 [Mucidula mucida]
MSNRKQRTSLQQATDPPSNATGSKSPNTTGPAVNDPGTSKTASGSNPSQRTQTGLRSNPDYTTNPALNYLHPTPRQMQTRARSVSAQDVSDSPSRTFPAPSSLSQPANPRQPFDLREVKANNTIELVSSTSNPGPSTHDYPPSTSKTVNPQEGAAHSAPLNDEGMAAHSAVPVPLANEGMAANSAVPPDRSVPIDKGKTAAHSAVHSEASGKVQSTKESVVAETASVRSNTLSDAESLSIDSLNRMWQRSSHPHVRILLNVGRHFELYDEDIGITVNKSYNYRLLEDEDPLAEFGAAGGHLRGLSHQQSMRIREALVRWSWPLEDFWEDVSSAIDDRIDYERKEIRWQNFKVKLQGGRERRVWSIGKGNNDIGYWGHLVQAVTQILEVFQQELGSKSTKEPPFVLDQQFSLIRTLEGHEDKTTIVVAMSDLILRLKLARNRIRQYINALRAMYAPKKSLSEVSSYDSTLPEIRAEVNACAGEDVVWAYALRPGYIQKALTVDPALRENIPQIVKNLGSAYKPDNQYYRERLSAAHRLLPRDFQLPRHVAFAPEPTLSAESNPFAETPQPATNLVQQALMPIPASISAMLHHVTNNPSTANPSAPPDWLQQALASRTATTLPNQPTPGLLPNLNPLNGQPLIPPNPGSTGPSGNGNNPPVGGMGGAGGGLGSGMGGGGGGFPNPLAASSAGGGGGGPPIPRLLIAPEQEIPGTVADQQEIPSSEVPEWDGKGSSLIAYLIEMNDLALVGAEVHTGIARIAPRRWKGNARAWWVNTPNAQKNSIARVGTI